MSRLPAPPSIGSPEWYEELAAAGADRAVVDEQVRVALLARGTGQVDPHAVGFAGEPAEVAAAWVLLHQSHPWYAALMYLRHDAWFGADKPMRDWIVRQFAAMLVHGPGPVAESGEYGW